MSGGSGADGGNMGRGGGPDAGSMDANAFGGGTPDWGGKQESSPAAPKGNINLFGIDAYDDVVKPFGTSFLSNETAQAIYDEAPRSVAGKILGAKTLADIISGLNVVTMTYGAGQALKNYMENAGFTVTEEGPGKKGQIPGQETDTTGSMLDFMDLNFKGMEGVSVDPIGDAVFDLSQSFASNYDNPVSYNNAVINAINNLSSVSTAGGDPTANVAQREASERRAAAAKIAAQQAAEALLAKEAAAAAAAAANQKPAKEVEINIPVKDGPPVNVRVPTRPQRPKTGKEAANATSSGLSPIQIAAASIVANQNKFKKLPKRIQKELRSGRQPTGSDYNVDRAMAIIKPPKPYNPPSESHLKFGGSGRGR